MSERQELLDQFYFAHGPCCAGCDWWRSWGALTGECTKTAPVGGAERIAALDIVSFSGPMAPGHIPTRRDHVCGDFKDDFDWESLPLPYRKRIGQLDNGRTVER